MDKIHWKILLLGLLLGNDPGCNCKKNSSVQNDPSSAPISIGDSTDEKSEEKKLQSATSSGKSNASATIENKEIFQEKEKLLATDNTVDHSFIGPPKFCKEEQLFPVYSYKNFSGEVRNVSHQIMFPFQSDYFPSPIMIGWSQMVQRYSENYENLDVTLIKSAIEKNNIEHIENLIQAQPQLSSEIPPLLICYQISEKKFDAQLWDDLLEKFSFLADDCKKSYIFPELEKQFISLSIIEYAAFYGNLAAVQYFMKKLEILNVNDSGRNIDPLVHVLVVAVCGKQVNPIDQVRVFRYLLNQFRSKGIRIYGSFDPRFDSVVQMSLQAFHLINEIMETSNIDELDPKIAEKIFLWSDQVEKISNPFSLDTNIFTLLSWQIIKSSKKFRLDFKEGLENLYLYIRKKQKLNNGQLDPFIETIDCFYRKLIRMTIDWRFSNFINKDVHDQKNWISSFSVQGNRLKGIKNFQELEKSFLQFVKEKLKEKKFRKSLHLKIQQDAQEINDNFIHYNPNTSLLHKLLFLENGSLKDYFINELKKNSENIEVLKIILFRFLYFGECKEQYKKFSKILLSKPSFRIELIKKAICFSFVNNHFDVCLNKDKKMNLVSHLLDSINRSKEIRSYQELEESILRFIKEKLKEEELLSCFYQVHQNDAIGMNEMKMKEILAFGQGQSNILQNIIVRGADQLKSHFFEALQKNPKNMIHVEVQRIVLCYWLVFFDEMSKVKKEGCKNFLKKLFKKEKPSEIFEDFHAIQEIIKESNLEAILKAACLNLFKDPLVKSFDYDGSLKTTLAQIGNLELPEEFLFSMIENGHLDLLDELLEQKNSTEKEKLLRICLTWKQEIHQKEAQSRTAEDILDPDDSSLKASFNQTHKIYQSLEVLMNHKLNKDDLGKIQGEDQFFDEIFAWNFVQGFLKEEKVKKICDLKEKLQKKLPSWNFREAAQKHELWQEVSQCLANHGVSEEKIQELRNKLVQLPSWDSLRDQLFALMEYSLWGVKNDAAKRKEKIETLRALYEYFIKNALRNKKNSDFLEPFFELGKIYVRIMQKGLFLLFNQCSAKDQDAIERKAFQKLYLICKKGYLASLDLEERLPNLKTWEIQEKDSQELEERVDQFWRFFFVQQDFIGLNFLGESIEDSSEEPDEDGTLLKEKIYSVQPGDNRVIQMDFNLLNQLKGILGRKISPKDIQNNDLLNYFACIIQRNPDLRKFIIESEAFNYDSVE